MFFKRNKKKAFTLTELLVVVVIIGILATVALPKFNKVLLTRRTTEAEEMLRAIRTEQERRCALDKPYVDLSALSDIVPNTNTDSYVYMAQASGVSAQSRQLDYQLQIPSYADGRICCEGDGCSRLNKDYPTCEDLRRMPDYEAPNAACAATLPGETGDPVECGPRPADEERLCSITDPNSCGTETRPYYCDVNTGTWKPGLGAGWNRSACTPRPRQFEFEYGSCPEGQFGRRMRTKTTILDCEGNVVSTQTTDWVSQCYVMNHSGTGYYWLLIQQRNIGPLPSLLIASLIPPLPAVFPVQTPTGVVIPTIPQVAIVAACAIGGTIGTIQGSSQPSDPCDAQHVGDVKRTYLFELADWYWQFLGPPVCNLEVNTYQCVAN